MASMLPLILIVIGAIALAQIVVPERPLKERILATVLNHHRRTVARIVERTRRDAEAMVRRISDDKD